MKTRGLVLVGVAALLSAIVFASLPPARLDVATPGRNATGVRGVMHVHSTYSDGGGTFDAIAAAAARAGLRFVVVTDHGDATRVPEPASYRSGVLVIDAAEVSTNGGHLVVVGGLPSPYPLGGEPEDVVEDVRRLGGFAVAAHPDSAKPELRWRGWTAAVDGFEWLNGDSGWRDEPSLDLARALLAYPFARERALARLLDRPDETLRRWDGRADRRPLVALAGSDAHARLEFTSNEPRSGRLALPLPGYETVFRAFSMTVPALSLTGDAARDAMALLAELRAGHVYTSVDALAAPGWLDFRAEAGDHVATAGDTLAATAPVTLVAATNAPRGARVSLLRNGQVVAAVDGTSLRYEAGTTPGIYRLEVTVPGAPGAPPIPWLLSNAIVVGGAADADPASGGPSRAADEEVEPPAPRAQALATTAGWRIEASARSKGALDAVTVTGGRQALWRWALGGTRSENPYVALVVPAETDATVPADLLLRARAARPTRVSVQLRMADGRRFRQSVYLDEQMRQVRLPGARFVAADGGADRGGPVRDRILVVDTVNTKPGTSGQIWIEALGPITPETVRSER